ncbi:MAG TPA: transcription antitermination factor NusB [Acidimicrobiales bacterium]|nr:transcription antitermination factor NusB [Acidimicrobiales bacterium]
MSELGRRRHRARARALELAYEANMKSRAFTLIVGELPVTPDPYTVLILTSAEENQVRIEQLIEQFSREWPLDRLAVVDRLIMTLALAELIMSEPPPTAVVLDEAVELAKVYSTEESASFVNGVLAACVTHLQ